MAQLLFCLSILATIGTLLLPTMAASRGQAVWSWVSNLLAGGAIDLLIKEYYPSWVEPQWRSGIVWSLIAWTFLIGGLFIALRKPRKRNLPVA